MKRGARAIFLAVAVSSSFTGCKVATEISASSASENKTDTVSVSVVYAGEKAKLVLPRRVAEREGLEIDGGARVVKADD